MHLERIECLGKLTAKIMVDQLRASQGVTLNQQFEIVDEAGRILDIIRLLPGCAAVLVDGGAPSC